ncbi:putative aquaporin-3 [Recurvomyces mirabilis]|uniref:Aquaporin-3 n=1 Tax=Recurvomyces mirabilis TaxID=574656 RepID=A0AAE0WIP4_9PEZI|nr:putative aquaporin-3 [Recurvomyces mirabilis]
MGDRSFSERHSASNPFFGFFGPTKDAKTVSTLQGHLVAMSGEFVGTFMFLFLAYAGHTMVVDQSPLSGAGPNGTNSATTVVYISLAYGVALLVTVWTMYRISGGLFNPAVTFGLIITGNIPLVRGVLLLPVQIIASIIAAGIISAILPGSIRTVETTLTPTMSVAQGVFLEMFLTAIFILNILMLAAEKSKDTFVAPIGIGLTLFVCEIAGVFYTGASLNPARSFGPCVVGRNFQTYHWIYWIGPLLGALVAAGYYHFVKFFNYEDANPGQDSSGGQHGGS